MIILINLGNYFLMKEISDMLYKIYGMHQHSQDYKNMYFSRFKIELA